MNTLRKIAASIGITFVVFSQLLFASSASAESVSGLNVEVYTYDSSATPDRVPYTPCEGAWTHVDNIDADFDNQFSGVVAGCQQEFTLVHYTGFVTFPKSGTYAFMAPADDGFWLSLDETPIITDDWVLKGRWGQVYPDIQISGGHTYALDAWFYEYGGGASNTLMYSEDNGSTWNTVPTEFFTTDGSTPVFVPDAFLNPPLNVQAVASGTDVTVTWKAPIDSGTLVEHYALTWTYDGQPGWGVGVWGTEFTITGLPENKEVTVWVRADNDTKHIYSANSIAALATTGVIPVVPPIDPPTPVDPDPPTPVDPPVDPVDPVDPGPIDPGQGPVEEPTLPVETPPSVPEEPAQEEQPTNQENVTPEPPITQEDPANIDPTTLSPTEVEQLQEAANETLATSEPGSPEYEKALEQLWVAAQADDIEVDPALLAIPLLGNAAAAFIDAVNFVGNVGADMSPKVRAESKKIVISAVVAVGAAVSAATGAATSAATAAASTSSTRKND